MLKLLPDVDNHTPKVAQLVRVNLYDVRLRGAWGGARRAVHDPARRLPGRGASGRTRARGPAASLGHDAERRSSRARLPGSRAPLGSLKKSNFAS